MRETSMTLLHKTRLRVMALLVAVGLAAFAVVGWTTAPVWPVVGVAVAVSVAAMNTMTKRLQAPVCLNCGTSIADAPVGIYGRVCPECGSISGAGPNDTKVT